MFSWVSPCRRFSIDEPGYQQDWSTNPWPEMTVFWACLSAFFPPSQVERSAPQGHTQKSIEQESGKWHTWNMMNGRTDQPNGKKQMAINTSTGNRWIKESRRRERTRKRLRMDTLGCVCFLKLQNMTLKTSARRIIITSFKNKLINKAGLLKIPARNIWCSVTDTLESNCSLTQRNDNKWRLYHWQTYHLLDLWYDDIHFCK